MNLRLPSYIALFCAFMSLAVAGCAMSPKTSLLAEDIPVTIGTTFAAYQNSGAEATRAVTFDLKGPWDFAATSGDAILRSRLIKVSQAPSSKQFPSATYAEQVLPSVQTGGVPSYNFAARSTKTLAVYGQSSRDSAGEETFKRYTKPERLLVFPVRIGASWSDKIAATDSPSRQYLITRKVVAKGEVITPAGAFFDCFMVRVTREPTGADKETGRTIMYVWWAPGVGPVAAVGSQAGETKLLFTQAAYIWRLQDYKVALKP